MTNLVSRFTERQERWLFFLGECVCSIPQKIILNAEYEINYLKGLNFPIVFVQFFEGFKTLE